MTPRPLPISLLLPDPSVSSGPPYIPLLLQEKKQFISFSLAGSDQEETGQEFWDYF